jgi:hypothetical protein
MPTDHPTTTGAPDPDDEPGHDPLPAEFAHAVRRVVDLTAEAERMRDEFRERADAQTTSTITAHGWALQAADSDDGLPGVVHTVGLSAYGHHPELLVIGLRIHAAARLLDALAEEVRAGHRLPVLCACTDVPGWPRIALIEADPNASAALLESANRRYQDQDGPPVRALQVVWCDPGGSLPWEPGWMLPGHAQPLVRPPFADGFSVTSVSLFDVGLGRLEHDAHGRLPDTSTPGPGMTDTDEGTHESPAD